MKTVFNYNTPVTAEWFNVVNGFRLRFDGDPLLPGDMVDGQYLPIRLQDLDPAILAGYSQSLDIVSTNTDQNINGNKTFINPVTVAPGISANHAITKAQLDATITTLNAAITAANAAVTAASAATAALNAATVKLTTDQTIAGEKTFSSSPLVPPGSVPGAAVNKAQLDAITPNFKIQYGSFSTGVALGAGGNTTGTLTFPVAFTSPPKVVASVSSESFIAGVGAWISQQTDNPTTNTQWKWVADSASFVGICTVDWIAIGV